MKSHKQRFLSAIIATMLLIAAIPVFSAFAGSDETEIEASEKTYELYLGFDTGIGLGNSTDTIDVPVEFKKSDKFVNITVPEYSNSANKFLYWRDSKYGGIYYPNDTYTIDVSKIEWVEEEDCPVGWNFQAVWEGNLLAVEKDATIWFYIPSKESHEDYMDNDGLNYYDYYNELSTPVKGIYNLKTQTFTFESSYDFATIPSDYVPTFEGYKFVEWNTKMDGSGTGYQPGDKVKLKVTAVSLYAVFEEYTKKNVIKVDAMEWRLLDDNGAGRYVEYLQYDENGVIPEFTAPPALTNKVGEFSHWYCAVTGESYYPNQTYYNVDVSAMLDDPEWDYWTVRNSFYLTAVWKTDEIYFDRDGMVDFGYQGGGQSWFYVPLKGIYNFKTDTYTFEGNHSFVIPTDIIPTSADGFEFLGWSKSPFASKADFKPGDTDEFVNQLNVTYYPIYETEYEFTIDNDIDKNNDENGVNTNVNFVNTAEPDISLILKGDKNIDEVKVLVTDIADSLVEDVLNSVKQCSESLNVTNENYSLVDVSLVDKNTDTEVDIESGKLKITLNYPNIPNAKNYNYKLYHYVDGKAEDIQISQQDEGIVFFAYDFSPYMLVWSAKSGDNDTEKDTTTTTTTTKPNSNTSATTNAGKGDTNNTKSPGTGDNFNPAIFILLAIISAAMIGSIIKSKEKQEISKL